jgi:hypothetical protein
MNKKGAMPRRDLLSLLLVFGLLATVYSLSTPLFEAPDEPWHYAYVRWLAEGHGLPRLDDDASGAGQEVAQPPLYYAVAALVNGLVGDDDLAELFWHNPQFGYQAGGTVNDNKNMLVHTDRERWPWRGAVLAVRLARLVSLAFGLLTVGATYGLAREVLLKRPARSTICPSERGWPTLATVAAGAVAFTPQFLFISGVVSNDSAAAATCTCALWALARIIRRGPTHRRAAVAGLALGLALLSKTSTLLLLPMALLALGLGRRRETALIQATLMLGLAGAVGGWWYLRNWLLFDDPLGLSVHVNTLWGRPAPLSLTALLPEMPQVFRSFWGAFGWGHVELPGPLYLALGGSVGLALAGWARRLALLRRARPLQGFRAIAGIYLLAVVWFLAVLAALLRWVQQVQAPHGRLLFPALGAWGLLLAAGWAGLPAKPGRQPSRISRYLVLVPVIGLLFLSLLVPFAVIRPAFARPRLLSPQQASQGIRSQKLVYDGRARLLGYRVEPESVAVGERVELTLCWEALRPMDRDYTLFIHLLGRDNARVAERTTYSGQGRFPTSLWPAGRAFCESYRMQVASWAEAPELYALEVGLYDAETGWRLPARNVSGQAIEPPTVGLVRVTPAAPLPLPAQPLSYDLGGQIALVGYNASTPLSTGASTTLASGDMLTLTLYWQALQVPQGDYKVFVHLLDEEGELVTQDDASPRDGRYPTWAWQAGDLVPDPHQLRLPDERPPGPYHLAVGMYYPESGDRLPVSGPQGPLPDRAILLGVRY